MTSQLPRNDPSDWLDPVAEGWRQEALGARAQRDELQEKLNEARVLADAYRKSEAEVQARLDQDQRQLAQYWRGAMWAPTYREIADEVSYAKIRETHVRREAESIIDYIPADGRNPHLYQAIRSCADKILAILDFGEGEREDPR